ncbi:hypothetical protein KFE25_006614 [Diacronema lutheri]|uniref:Uncharacterized protein n=1 Tax=Diacronema lutheri TaxID=2081491 RepID=A0A7R9YIE4_DIALT|nr:hypothetical protein KFE25_006614 [Diacronema lutheri]|mmetsp:Transcript_16120/g.50229  ORF Transcript_16120/g.50229 Transcript_16120/m.50229 type:complete len:134 (+) Transcript_16120:21-422(+)
MADVALRNAVRRGDLPFVKSACKELTEKDGGLDLALGGDTLRAWNALHIACWGTARPDRDREILEALLLAATRTRQIDALKAGKDRVDGKTALDLLKERRDAAIAANGVDARDLELKKHLDKSIEWLEKGYEL